ncbi:MAG: hypothetical protein IJ168_07580 [Eubacterium sp.]|nr:hypothetical protein [Eubacterium sp.]
MKTFEVDNALLQKGWGADGQYWFSLNDYSVKEHSAFAHYDRPHEMTEEAFMLTLGFIPYFRVQRIELAKAYVATVSNRKLQEALAKIDDEHYIEAFWKYFNAYPEVFAGYEDFQNAYLLQKAERWCTDNNIAYKIV